MNHKKTHVLKSLAVCLPTASLADVWSERQSTVLKFDSSWSQNVVSEKASGVATAFTLSFSRCSPLKFPCPQPSPQPFLRRCHFIACPPYGLSTFPLLCLLFSFKLSGLQGAFVLSCALEGRLLLSITFVVPKPDGGC